MAKGTIQINDSTYNATIKKIEKANNRTAENQGNIKITYENCDMSYLNNYISIVERLQKALGAYFDLLTEDIKNLGIVRDNLKEVDK